MKKTLKYLLPGALALAFFAAPSAIVPNVAAQDPAAAATPDPEKDRLDKLFRDNRTSNRDIAYKAAKDYLAKFENAGDNKEFVDYLKGWLVKEDKRRDDETKAAVAIKCSKPIQDAAKATVAAEKAKFASDVFSGCQQYAAQEPNNEYPYIVPVDYGLELATANPPINNYNDQTITLAKQAIQKIESNSFPNANWQTYRYANKEDALSWLNYTIGMITFYNLTGKEAEAVPYFYKALQNESDVKKRFQPYYALGYNYRVQYNKAVQDFQTKYANASEVTDEMKKDIGIQKALAERAIDAFARAYKAAVDGKLSTQSIDARKKDLEQMYKIRYKDQTTDWNTLASSTASKPLPDPASPVTPVMEELTPTTTGTGSAASGMTATAEPSKSAAENTPAKTTTAASTKAATTNGAAKPAAAKPAAAKPAPKKKPSR